MGRRSGGEGVEILGRHAHAMENPMSQSFDASRSLTAFEQDSTLVAVIEMSQSKWLVAAVIPGVARQPLKQLDADAGALLKLLQRLARDSRDHSRNEPLRLAHLDYRDQCAILLEGGEGPAGVKRLRHGGPPWRDHGARACPHPRRRSSPIASGSMRGDDGLHWSSAVHHATTAKSLRAAQS